MNALQVCSQVCAALCLAVAAASAASPAEVQQRLAAAEKLTFVDVRSTTLFQKGHIPGAINVPAALAPLKQLPPLGRVVVYDDGLGLKTAQAAAAALNQKSGITAEVLDGGYAAWETARGTTTRPPGLKPEEFPIITYALLKERQSEDVVLVDLRQPAGAASLAKAASERRLTDLNAEFPKARVVRSPFEVTATPARAGKSAAAAAPPLLVLIDRGDGTAQAMARTLKANGITRFAILPGGEEILARKGEPGLQRIGSVSELKRPAQPTPASRSTTDNQ